MAYPGNHIGTLIKPHGFKGELLLKGNPQYLENLEPGNPLFVEIDGQGIPFFIEDVSLLSNGEKAVIKLEFITSDTVARRYIGCDVFTDEIKTASTDSLKTHEYLGLTVKDTVRGNNYLVTDYHDHPGNPVLLIKGDKEELILPLNADYIGKLDKKKGILYVEFPEGFTEAP